MKARGRARHNLVRTSGTDFQREAIGLLSEVLEGSTESKRLGRLDRRGVDIYTYSPDDLTIELALQCKGFEVEQYGPDQHRQCRGEIKKYKLMGPSAPSYWLVLNRPITERRYRDELLNDLEDLRRSGKVSEVLLLDLDPFMTKVQALAIRRLAIWAKDKQSELFEYYNERLRFTDYLPDVPFTSGIPARNPVGYIARRVTEFFSKLPPHQTGRYRPAPKLLITSSFGFGKTRTLHAVAGEWVRAGGKLLYVPAALLEAKAFGNASDLTNGLLAFLLPSEVELTATGHQLFRDTLRYTLSSSTDWIVLLDGLDENAALLKPDALQRLRNCFTDLGIPAIVSAREEVVSLRSTEFLSASIAQRAPVFEKIELQDWDDCLILSFLKSFEAGRADRPSAEYLRFRELVRAGQYTEIYGDIPKRPLFLGMLAEDAWLGEEPARELHRLYGKYFRAKFSLDQYSMAGGGVSSRSSRIVEALGVEEAVERLILIMQDVAGAMASPAGPAMRAQSLDVVQEDTIAEDALQVITRRHGIEFFQMEDVVLHTLLQPAGRSRVTRRRLVRFAHRSFQDWFLARKLAFDGNDGATLDALSATARFLASMRADLSNGGDLP